jgi:hypothetical protein
MFLAVFCHFFYIGLWMSIEKHDVHWCEVVQGPSSSRPYAYGCTFLITVTSSRVSHFEFPASVIADTVSVKPTYYDGFVSLGCVHHSTVSKARGPATHAMAYDRVQQNLTCPQVLAVGLQEAGPPREFIARCMRTIAKRPTNSRFK